MALNVEAFNRLIVETLIRLGVDVDDDDDVDVDDDIGIDN